MTALGDRLRLRARDDADKPAVHASGRWWTYAELMTAADRLASQLPASSGEVIAIAIDHGLEAVLALCATALTGAIPAMLDPRDRGMASHTLHTLAPAAVLALPGSELPGARALDVARLELDEPGELPWAPLHRDPRTSHIIFTSGSTAGSKGVVWSELRTSFDWLINRPKAMHREGPAAIVVPVCTSLGFHELVRTLHFGLSAVIVDVPFVAALEELRELGANRIKLTPTHVELLLATAVEMPDLRTVSVASAPLSPQRARAVSERAPRAHICRSYGLTESGAATAVWLHKNRGKMSTVGRPISYRRVTVRDPDGRMLPPEHVGEVYIEVPMWDACDGYLDPTGAMVGRFANGVLKTGDRGAMDRHGFLVLGEREAEVLKVGGRSVSAPRVEQALTGIPGVRELVVVGVPDRWLGESPCAVYVPEPGTSSHDLPQRAAGVLTDGERGDGRGDDAPRTWLARPELPRGPTHKIRRGELAREAAAWTSSFPAVIAAGHQRLPAYDLEGGIAIVDGVPAEWCDQRALEAGSRVIALVMRQPMRPLAYGIVRAERGARFVVGPVAIVAEATRIDEHVSDRLLGVFAGELVHLALRLPGPPPLAVCALGDVPGFVPADAHPGWTWRREAGAADPFDGVDLAAIARGRDMLVEASLGAQRRSAAGE